MFGWTKSKPKTAAVAGGSMITVAAAAGSLILGDIKSYEGRSLKPYKDIAGIWTYCDGETLNAAQYLKKVFTNQECDAITLARSIQVANKICDSVSRPIGGNQIRAFATFSDNAGYGAWLGSTARREFNKGNVTLACNSLMKFICYKPPNGKGETRRGQPCYSKAGNLAVSKGLINRRESERDKCLAPWDGVKLPEGVKCR